MGLKVNFAMQGLRGITKKLAKIKAATSGGGLKDSFDEVGQKVVYYMDRDAPEDTGRLKRHIDYTATEDNLIFESEAIDPITGRDYAPAQEYGGRHFSAQPYFHKNIRKHGIPGMHQAIKDKLK